MERPVGEPVGMAAEKGLAVGFAASQGVEVDLFVVQIDGGADEAVLPVPVGDEVVPKDGGDSLFVRATDEDDLAMRPPCEIKAEVAGHFPAGGGGLSACGAGVVDRGDVACRALAQCPDASMMKPGPDLCLPAGVVAFDGVLEALLGGWSEDGDDAKGKTQAGDASQGVGKLVGALEDGIIVEVGVGWQAVCSPVLEEGIDHAGGADGLLHGPALDESAEERDDIEDLDEGAVLDAQSLDDIQAVDLREALGGDGQVPGPGGSFAAQAAPAVERAMAGENTADGALAGR